MRVGNDLPLFILVAIPLGQGRVFNKQVAQGTLEMAVAIPLGQGRVFNRSNEGGLVCTMSQSLWVRDGFLIAQHEAEMVAARSQSLWVRDGFLIKPVDRAINAAESQSLWVRDGFLIVRGVFSPCFQCVAGGVSNFCFCEKVGASAVVFFRIFHGVFGVALFR